MDLPHVLVGCDTGLLKGVNIKQKSFVNVATDPTNLVNKSRAVDVLFYEEKDSLNIRLGLRNRDIICLDVADSTQHFSRIQVDGGDGKFVGSGMIGNNTVSCVESGQIFLNEGMQKSQQITSADGDVRKFSQSAINQNLFMSGGKENHVKLWDMNQPKIPIFTGKNLPDDKLRLKVQTWINDIKFRPDSGDKVILTASAYHLIQLYDIRVQRKPLRTVSYGEDPLTSFDISPHKEFEFVVANRNGKIATFDMRGTKGLQLRAFTGNQGTVREIRYHPQSPGYFASIGLDRFIRFYGENQRVFKSEIYLKSTPSTFLFTNEPVRSWGDYDNEPEAEPAVIFKTSKRPVASEEEIVESDAVWNEMTPVEGDTAAVGGAAAVSRKKKKVKRKAKHCFHG